MADDFNNLVCRRDNTRDSYNERKQEIERLEEKKRRLSDARKNLNEYKRAFEREQHKDKKTIDEKRNWKGENYKRYNAFGEALKSINKAYYDNVKDIIDVISAEINNIQREINSKWSLAYWLYDQLQNIQAQINSFFS